MPATGIGRSRRTLPGQRAIAIDRSTVVRVGIVAGTAILAMLAMAAFGRPYNFFDLKIYHGAVVWWSGGDDIYDFVKSGTTLGFTYPPFAALAMLPMSLLSVAAAGWINAWASLLALGFILTVLLTPIADRLSWPRWYAVGVAMPLAVAIEPVRETIGYGQVNLLLGALIVADLVSLRRRHAVAVRRAARRAGHPDGTKPKTDRLAAVRNGSLLSAPWLLVRYLWTTGALAGVGVGLATAVKLTPALFIVYFVLTRQWRVACTAALTALAATAGTFVVAGTESSRYFAEVLWETNRIGNDDATPNQSLAGVLARLYDSPETPGLLWLAFAMLLLAVGLSRARTAHTEGDELTAFTLVALTANVVCPISWTHHMVFVVCALVVLVDAGLRRRSAARGLGLQRRLRAAGLRYLLSAAGLLALFVVSPIWPYEHQLGNGVSHYADGLTGALWENSLGLAMIVLVTLLPWRTGADPVFYAERQLRLAPGRPIPPRRNTVTTHGTEPTATVPAVNEPATSELVGAAAAPVPAAASPVRGS